MNALQAKVTENELRCAAKYFADRIESGSFNFSFTTDGVELERTNPSISITTLSDDGNVRCVRRTISTDGLVIVQDAKLYRDLPVVEWVLHVTNSGDSESGCVRFSALTDTFKARRTVIYHQNGSDASRDDFKPFTTELSLGESFSTKPFAGLSSNRKWPYFTIDNGDCGLNIAIGWPTQWKISFTKRNDMLDIECGQEMINSRVLPGELFRSPRMVVQFWDANGLSGDDAVIRSRNIFRKYIINYNMPRGKDGKPPFKVFAACSSHQNHEMINATAADQMKRISAYKAKNIDLDYWWMDAGWFPCPNGEWHNADLWEHDPVRFPKGLREVADYAHERNVGILVWHEPERVNRNSRIYTQHHDFILDYPDDGNPEGHLKTGDPSLYNFGDKAACDWMIEKINSNIDKYGIDLYRQDYNAFPISCWLNGEPEDRRGSRENLYAQGLFRYWDSIRERHPGMLLDNCCAGGRRNDIDSLSRCIPLIRSDCLFVPEEQQSHTIAVGGWLPFFGTGLLCGTTNLDDARKLSKKVDTYPALSFIGPGVNSCSDILDDNLDWKKLKTVFDAWLSVADCYHGDFYPFTSFGYEKDTWCGWQFHKSEDEKGFIQVFRRPENAEPTHTFRLSGLSGDGQYAIFDLDTNESFIRSGSDLMESGICFALDPASAKLYSYSKI